MLQNIGYTNTMVILLYNTEWHWQYHGVSVDYHGKSFLTLARGDGITVFHWV
jgi:hypothetical protein